MLDLTKAKLPEAIAVGGLFYRIHIDLSVEPLHWHQFSALLAGLRDTKLNDVIGFRLWENTSGKRDEYTRAMQHLHDAWEIEVKDDEEDAALAEFEAALSGSQKKEKRER